MVRSLDRVAEATSAAAGNRLARHGAVCHVLLKPSHFLVQALPVLSVLNDRCVFATWDEIHDLVIAGVVKVLLIGIWTEGATVSLPI